MLQIIVAPRNSDLIKPALMDSMFQLRKSIFADRLQWHVDLEYGRERDIYDNQNPHYLIAFDSNLPNIALGCWRLLPTTGPYMLSEVFPPLLGDNPAPYSPNSWEISRFAMARISSEPRFGFGSLATAMLRALWCQARRQGLCEIVGVTSTPIERMLVRLGFLVERYDDPRRIGRVNSVAFRLPILDEVERDIFCSSTLPQKSATAWRATVGPNGELLQVTDLSSRDRRVVA
ncbi:acyl-homoserine-lactone synthase [Microbulbifer sp.]|uniref:acyl-homoserine-lactone synthase n=1 Tax=Microbulbifer sp. TaxID=1908541 RepID=UPI002589FDB3|nr:acyl-homoserine-lactone synthase [Microbulbifer sp.]